MGPDLAERKKGIERKVERGGKITMNDVHVCARCPRTRTLDRHARPYINVRACKYSVSCPISHEHVSVSCADYGAA